jgi:hypothetical protein
MKTISFKTMVRLAMAVLRQAATVALGGETSEITLASSPSGRIVLHLLCSRRDHHFRWHWQGVVREFARA